MRFLSRHRDCGILIIRIGIGICFIFHGWPKIHGGPDMWRKVGEMAHMPIPTVMGFIGGLIEFGGGILFATGSFFRYVCVLLALQMAVALFAVHLPNHDPFGVYAHPLEDLFVFLGMLFIGPGKFSVDGADKADASPL